MPRPRPRLPTLFCAGACALAAIASVTWTSRAVASPPQDLEWTAPRECPTKAEIRARVERLVGPTHGRGDTLRARSVVSKDEGGGFHGEVSLADDPSPARRIDGDSCDAVADAIVLILAIAVNPDVATEVETTRTADAPTASVAPAGAVAGPAERSEIAAVDRDRARPFAVSGAGVVDSGLFGVATPGAELALGLRFSHVSLDLAGTWLATTHATIAARPSEGSSVNALQVVARGCGAFGGGRITGGPCLGAGVSSITARGFGAAQPADRGALVPVGIVGGRASYRLASALAVWAEVDAVLAGQRPTLIIDNAGTVAQLPLATGRLTAGLEMRF